MLGILGHRVYVLSIGSKILYMQSIMNCFVIGEMEKYIYSNIHTYICTYNIENRGAYICYIV
jgi:hypothetical protein